MSINIQESFQKMPLGEKIILIVGPLLFIDSFLHWYSASVCVGDFCVGGSANGWGAPGSIWSILAVLIGIALSALVAVTRFTQVKLPELPQGVTWARVYLGGAVAAAVFILIKLINHSGDLAIGFFIGIILVAAMVVGGGLLFQAERGGMGGGGSTTSSM
jgi:hypothetical protein